MMSLYGGDDDEDDVVTGGWGPCRVDDDFANRVTFPSGGERGHPRARLDR